MQMISNEFNQSMISILYVIQWNNIYISNSLILDAEDWIVDLKSLKFEKLIGSGKTIINR